MKKHSIDQNDETTDSDEEKANMPHPLHSVESYFRERGQESNREQLQRAIYSDMHF